MIENIYHTNVVTRNYHNIGGIGIDTLEHRYRDGGESWWSASLSPSIGGPVVSWGRDEREAILNVLERRASRKYKEVHKQ